LDIEPGKEAGADVDVVARGSLDVLDCGEDIRIVCQGILDHFIDVHPLGILGDDAWDDLVACFGKGLRRERHVLDELHDLVDQPEIIGRRRGQGDGPRRRFREGCRE
jgi:hypothetical protein